MKKNISKRILSLVLVLAMLCSFVPPVQAAHEHEHDESLAFEQLEEPVSLEMLNPQTEQEDAALYEDTDIVRVSIVMEEESTLEQGYSTEEIAENESAMSYRDSLKEDQANVTASIEKTIGDELDVKWNLTLAANIISANVEYGQIEQIKAVDGVADVIIETCYEPAVLDQDEEYDPNMATSGQQIGSSIAWANGYTGAGSRIAVIDTGIDSDHQSFSAAGFDYSLSQLAAAENMEVDDYVESLNLLDAKEIASKLDQLNVGSNFTAESLYVNSKIAFGYNYIDEDVDIVHDNDSQGSHGSHVSGIATANAYIPNSDGTYSKALDKVYVQGVAPDAQLITMKVFGKAGGAYDSDYMAAIEDAIILGADSINLSLGSTSNGFVTSNGYQEIMDSLTASGTVATMSAGNAGNWAQYSKSPAAKLYADDINYWTGGSPGSFTNSLGVASVQNAGQTGYYFTVDGSNIFYNESDYSNEPLATLSGEREYIYIDGIGTAEDWAAVGDALTGKVAFCSRGTTSFFQKGIAAVEAGAIATVIYNNQDGTINMDLTDYTKTAPCVSITQEEGAAIKAASTPVTDDEGNVLYYTGKMTINGKISVGSGSGSYYTMSSFSSWGVPSALILKPEITTPGGNIYSVNGVDKSGTAYENNSGTSMAAPQAAGMVAVIAQYIREKGLAEDTGLTVRQLAQSLLMSTAVPLKEKASGGNYYSVLNQGSGLANVGNAVTANSYILMGQDATASYADGKVKAELGDDAERVGEYTFSFTLNSLDDADQTYTLRADLFTQAITTVDGVEYLDTLTTPLTAKVTYLVDGQVFTPVSKADCDLDKDGDTDADDAQIVLNYTAGLVTEIEKIADVNGDGNVTTYDAYLILASLQTSEFTVAAGSDAEIVVKIVLNDSVKAAVNEAYENGAYVEGFISVVPTADAEGAIQDVTHSIPVLGFYGSWTDASMYDKSGFVERLYGDTTTTYLGVSETNAMTVKYEGDNGTYYMSGNPYIVEDEYPAERIAINTSAKLNNYKISLIRNAAAVATFVKNEEGKLLYVSNPTANVFGAYYSTSSAAWGATSSTAAIGRSLDRLGVEEGERVTVGVVAIPEYYLMGQTATPETVASIIDSGVLGEGAYLTTSMLVDDTAPEVDDISKSLINDIITVTATDNNYIAAVMVTNKSGSQVYAEALPEQTEKNETVTLTLDLTGKKLGSSYVVTVADYAGNKTSYEVTSSAPEVDYTGQMFVWTRNGNRRTEEEKASGVSTYRWMKVDPDTLWYNTADNSFTGTENFANGDYTEILVNPNSISSHYLLAAEYVEGFVIFALKDGNIYSSPLNDMETVTYMSNWSDVVTAQGGTTIHAMHLNYADGYMYLLDDNENFYRYNIHTCELEYVFTVTLFNPNTTTAAYDELYDFAIHKDGTFYALNKGAFSKCFFLYKFTLDQVKEYDNEDGTKFVGIQNLEPMFNDKNSHLGFSGVWNPTQMAWDHDKEILYMVRNTSTNISANVNSKLYTIDLSTGMAVEANEYVPEGVEGGTSACFYNYVFGLFIVPGDDSILLPGNQANSVEVSAPRSEVLVNASMQFTADVGPWNLEDKSVTWSSSDESIATINADGVATFYKVGSVTITATSVAKPHVQGTYDVNVVTYPSSILAASVTGTDGVTHIAEFSTDDLTAITNITDSTANFLAGGLHEGKVYYHDGAQMYSVDAETQKITNLGVLASSWQWSDAASAPQYGLDLFNILIGLSSGGMYIELINPEDGTLRYFDLSSNEAFSADPFATICYAGPYADTRYPGYSYYVIRESGKIAKLSIFTETEGYSYSASVTNDRYSYDTGIDLSGVPNMGSGSYGSSFYDEATGYVLVTQTAAGEQTNLYAVDPNNGVTALIGTFSEDIELVNGLYMWDRARDTTVRLDAETLDLYMDETYDLTTTVLPEGTSQNVTYASSDEGVVTVDANGVVTPVGLGTATVTVTTEALTAEGVPATDTVTVNVKALTAASVTFTAQITDEEGNIFWGEVNTSDLSVTKISDAPNPITAGGYHDGKIYGTDGDYVSGGNIWQIDPANGYTGTKGAKYSSSYVYVDGASAPTMLTDGVTSGSNNVLYETCDFSVNLSNSGVVLLVSDYTSSSLVGFNLIAQQRGATAIALAGEFVFAPISTSKYLAYEYYILENDGDLHRMVIYPKVDTTTGAVSYSQKFTKTIANIGEILPEKGEASMLYVETETAKGLLVSYSGNANSELYFIDITSEYTADETDSIFATKIGTLPGVTDLASIYIPTVEGEEETLDPAGKMFTWTYNSTYRLNEVEKANSMKSRWMVVDPETLWFNTDKESGYAYTGTTNLDITRYAENSGYVLASEYVDGKAIFAHSDGYLYSAPINDLANATQLLYWKDAMTTVNDMALNYQDGYLYILGPTGIFFKYNVSTNTLALDFIVSSVCPNSTTATYKYPYAFAIDDNGTFYAVNYGGTAAKYMYLYKWTLSDVNETINANGDLERTITNLDPINSDKTDGYTGVIGKAPCQMTWDHDKDILYIIGNSGSTSSSNNGQHANAILYTLDTTTGKAIAANTYMPEGEEVGTSALMYTYVKGLFVVPSADVVAPDPVDPKPTDPVDPDPTDPDPTDPDPTDPDPTDPDPTDPDPTEPVDLGGKMYGFTTNGTYRSTVAETAAGVTTRWLEIDASTVWFNIDDNAYSGTDAYVATSYSNKVAAAAYVEGDVYIANNDGYLYKAPVTDLTATTQLVKWSDTITERVSSSDYYIVDMAYNVKDGNIYMLACISGGANRIYKYDIKNNTVALDHDVTIVNPAKVGNTTFTYATFRGMTIDENGNFYAVSNSRMGGKYQFLYKWTLDDVKETTAEDGTVSRIITDLLPVVNDASAYTGISATTQACQLVWDSDKDILYLYGGTSTWTGTYYKTCYLYTVDTTTGKAAICNTYYPEGKDAVGTSGLMFNYIRGAFYVPTATGSNGLGEVEMTEFNVTETEGFKFGTAAELSDSISISTDISELLGTEPVNVVGGSTNALAAEAVKVSAPEVSTDAADSEITNDSVTVKLTDTVDVYNGLVKVTYDPAQLTYDSTASVIGNTAVNVDTENGVITFAYATIDAVAAGSTIATIRFTYAKDYVNTTVTAATVQRNDELVSGESVALEVKYEVGGHDYQVTDEQAVTCTEDGWKVYTCSKCGDSYTETVESTGHSYDSVVTEPTCTEQGYTTHTCGNCGDTYVDNYVDAKGHSYEVVVKEPTCTEMGYTTYTCSICGDSYVSDYVNPTGHKYEAVVTEPTCTKAGYTTYICACGESYVSDYVEPTGHTYGEWETVIEPGCETKGQEKRTCECGETQLRDIDPTGHSYETTVVEPTCTKAGYTVHTCSVCGHSYMEDVTDPIGHSYEAVVTEPTCTELGYTTYTCSVCGDSYVSDFVEALGHSFGEWEVTVEADCFTDGEKVRTCQCGETETAVIAANSDNCPSKAFTDLSIKDWYHEGVDYVLKTGLMNGLTTTEFAPNAQLTRAQLVTILYRLEGKPSVEGLNNPFEDVPAKSWYTDAVIWAASTGIVKGVTNTEFAPDEVITREQIATILYRYTGAQKVAENHLTAFEDAGSVSTYAKNAMNWAVANGLITGVTETTLLPQGNATRAQIATILMRLSRLS